MLANLTRLAFSQLPLDRKALRHDQTATTIARINAPRIHRPLPVPHAPRPYTLFSDADAASAWQSA
jgi:hypothetical protein